MATPETPETNYLPDPEDINSAQAWVDVQRTIHANEKLRLEINQKISKLLGVTKDKQIELNHAVIQHNKDLEKENNIQKEITAHLLTSIGDSARDMVDWKKNEDSLVARLHDIRKEASGTKALLDYNIERIKEEDKHKRRYFDAFSSSMQKITGFQSVHLNKFKEINTILGESSLNLGKWAEILSTIGVILFHTFNIFKTFDSAAAAFRLSMGMIRNDTERLRNVAEGLAIEFMGVGVSIAGAYDAIRLLGREMGSVHAVSKDIAMTTALFKSQLGVTEEDSAGFMKNMAAVSKSTMQSQQNMAYIAADMSEAAGVPLASIMKDVATRSDRTLVMLSRIPSVVIRAAIELRKMGTSLGEAARSGRELLNFSENITAEMEASVLLGRSINLQRARELAYRRDLEGVTKEILRITRSIGFENLDVFQQEAFSRATGKTVDELLRMVQAERQWEAARADPTLSDKVEAYEKLHKSVQEEAKARGENLELMIKQRANQDRLTSISNRWNAILTKISEPLLIIIDKVLFIVEAMTSTIPILMSIGGVFGWISTKISNMVGLTEKFTSVLAWTSKFGTGLLTPIGKFLLTLGKVGGWVFKIGGFFGKWIPIVGWVIMGIQLIYYYFKNWVTFMDKWSSMDWAERVHEGLKAVFGLGAVYDTLVQPFKDAYDYIMKWWGGYSPSKLGLSILEGIMSIGSMIYNALIDPFKRGFAWILDNIPGMSKMADSLRGSRSDITGRPVETRAAATYIPAVTVTPNGTTIVGSSVSTKASNKTNTEESLFMTNETGMKLLNEICGLRADLNAGKIGINMDGQLLSATLDRQTQFRKGYGVVGH